MKKKKLINIPETSPNKPITIGRDLAEYADKRAQREIQEVYKKLHSIREDSK